MVPDLEAHTFYATFIVGEWDELAPMPGDTVLDCGANIGDYTIKASTLVGPTGRVIAIEPSRVARSLVTLHGRARR